MASKRIRKESKSTEEEFTSFNSKSVALYNDIDIWLARINSLQEYDIERKEISLSDAKNFLELINFLFSDYDLLYHGEIKMPGQLHRRDGYSHDSLKGYLTVTQKKIKAYEEKNERKLMKRKWELIDTQWVPKGHLLDEGVKNLKSIIDELKEIFKKKKFTVAMKETDKNSPYVFSISDNKKTEHLKRYEIVDFEKQLTDHPWSSKHQMRKKQKSDSVSSSSKIVSSSSEKVPQSTRKDRRIVVEDSPQATTSGNTRTSNLSVQIRQKEDPPSLKLSTISTELVPIQAPQYSFIAAFPFTNRNAISIIKRDGSTNELTGMVKQYLISEEENSRENFEHIVYSIEIFTALEWSFRDFFLGFEEMVLTLRKKLCEESYMIQDFTDMTIKKKKFDKSSESVITTNEREFANSLRRARHFINSFSLQIVKLFQAFHKFKHNHSKLTETIEELWPMITLTTDDVNALIPMLEKCIGEINAGDLLFINLSAKGFLKLRADLYEVLTSPDLLEYFKENEQQQCIKRVETYMGEILGEPYSFSKENSERLWKYLGEFYYCTLPRSSQRSALPIATLIPILETSVTSSLIQSGSPNSKRKKERESSLPVESSSPVLYALRSLNGSSGGNSGSVLDADTKKLIEARAKAITKAKNKAATKARAQKKGITVVLKKRKLKDDDNVSASDNDEAEYFGEEEEEEADDDDGEVDDDVAGVNIEEMAGGREKRSGVEDVDANRVAKCDESNDKEESEQRLFDEGSRRLTDRYIDIADEDWEEDTSNTQPYSTGNLKLPSLEKPQEVLEWLYEEMKDLFSTDVILQALDIIVNGAADSEAEAVDNLDSAYADINQNTLSCQPSNVSYESNQTSSSSFSSLVPSIAEKIAFVTTIDSAGEFPFMPTSFGSSSSSSSSIPASSFLNDDYSSSSLIVERAALAQSSEENIPSKQLSAGDMPFKPTIISSIEGTAIEKENMFPKSDYALVSSAVDNLFCKFGIGSNFSSIVMCLYLQALRTHFMTHVFFETRGIYRRLNNIQSYQKHKDAFLVFAEDLAEIAPADYKGVRTIKNALLNIYDHFDDSLSFFNLSLPPKAIKGTVDETLQSLNEVFSKFLQAKLDQQPSASVDLSVIFVDFKTGNGESTVIDFPNRIEVALGTDVYAYQTVGAVYKMTTEDGDAYALRILSRRRCEYEYVLMQQRKSEIEQVTCNVSYMDEWDPNNSTVRLETKKTKVQSFFPSELKINGKEKCKYNIEGVVLSLNEGQKEGFVGVEKVLPNVQNSLSLLEPVFSCSAHTLRAREIRILSSEHYWLSDEIMTPSSKKFLEVGQAHGLFPSDNLVVISPPSVLWEAVLQHLKEDPDKEKEKKKNSQCEMVFTDKALREGYEESKKLWEYKNIFSLPDRWFLSIINYPDNIHWMLVGMHASTSTYFIYDPMAVKGQIESVTKAVRAYIDLEFESFTPRAKDQSTVPSMEPLQACTWSFVICPWQTQPDKSNCGVLVLLAFFRAVSLLAKNKLTDSVCDSWSCPTDPAAFKKYRKELLHLLTDVNDAKDPTEESSKKDRRSTKPVGSSHAGFSYFTKVLLQEFQEETRNATTVAHVGLKIFITKKERVDLEGRLGYYPNEVDEMDPQMAEQVILRGIKRPPNGMPPDWMGNKKATIKARK